VAVVLRHLAEVVVCRVSREAESKCEVIDVSAAAVAVVASLY